MAAPFDAYYTWLGIPPAEQPPHHYRLLGVPLFESDMAVIGNAADRQMVYVKTFLDGPNAETAKRLLAELRAARLCLFDADQKGEYDAGLRSASGPGGSNGAAGTSPATDGAHPHSRPMPRRGFSPWGSSANVGGQLPPPAMPPPIPPPAIAVPQQPYSPLYPSAPYVPPASAVLPSAVSLPPLAATAVPTTPAPAPVESAAPSATLEAQRGASRPVPIDKPVPAAPVEASAIGSATGARLRDKQSRLRDTLLIATAAGLALLVGGIGLAYLLGGRTSKPEKVVAKKDRGSKSKGSSATDSGEKETSDPETPAKEPVSNDDSMSSKPTAQEPDDGISDAPPAEPKEPPTESPKPEEEPAKPTRKEEDPAEPVKTKPPTEPIRVKPPRAVVAQLERELLDFRLEPLKELSKLYKSEEHRAEVADDALSLVTPLLAEHRLEDADKMAKRAREISDYYVKKNPQKHAEIKDLVASAQIEVNKAKQVQQAFEKLKTSPDDKAANTTVGKYLCLTEGDFLKGLPLIAKGEDGPLKEAALFDLKSPVTPKEQVKLADDWFDLGAKDGSRESGFYARAAVWYYRALPELDGVPKRRVEANLRDVITTDVAAQKLRRKPGVGVIAGSPTATLKVSQRRKLAGHSGGTLCVTFLPDRKTLLSAGADDMIKRWDLLADTAPFESRGHQGPVTAITVLDDGKRLFSSSADGTLGLWAWDFSKVRAHVPLHSYTGSSSKLTFVAASIDGRNVVSGGSDGSVSFWGLARGQERKSVSAHEEPVTCLAFSPDGQMVASSGGETVKLWNMLDQLKATLNHSADVNTVAYSPDGKTIATGGDGKEVELWSADKYERREPLAGHAAAVTSAAFSPDGCWLASADADGEIIFWNPTTGKKQASISPGKDRIHCLAFSPDNGLLAAASDGGEILLLDLKVKYSATETPASADAKEESE